MTEETRVAAAATTEVASPERPETRTERPETRTERPETRTERPERTERVERGERRPGRGSPGGAGREGGARKFFRRKKVCKFCVEKIEAINYKDVRLLQQFVAESGKIVPRRLTGVCTPHQRRLSSAIKQARNIALLPFAGRA